MCFYGTAGVNWSGGGASRLLPSHTTGHTGPYHRDFQGGIQGARPCFKLFRKIKSNFASAVPVAAVAAREGESPALCIGLIEPTNLNHLSWTEIRRFVLTTAGRWRETHREWVNGEVCGRDGATPLAVHACAPDGALVAK